MKLKQLTNITFLYFLFVQCYGQDTAIINNNATRVVFVHASEEVQEPIVVGAERTSIYLNELIGKKVGVVANHTSLIKNTNLVDSLLSLKINVVRVFSPEHGFRGTADAGEKVKSNIDSKTGLPIISLYGKNKKPLPEQLKDLDVLIFDIQDVGARFYTYISTMHYVMEACAENKKKLILLDRPNPNGHFVDGPVLDSKFKSFVGMHPIPIVHGMTIGEYAKMINGEGWLANHVKCDLTIVEVKNYNHTIFYDLPVKPSPNLPNMSSIYLYPSLCLFEGTPISVGRGTDLPFQILGHPQLKSERYSFTPKSMEGAKNPVLIGEKCSGYNLSLFGTEYVKGKGSINLFWLIDIYNNFPDKAGFFNEQFNLLAGTDQLQLQIKAGKTEEEIIASWKVGITKFKLIRKKYLLYQDFE